MVKASSIALGCLAAYKIAECASEDEYYSVYHSSAFDRCMSDDEKRIEAEGGLEAVEERERKERERIYREKHPGLGGSDTLDVINC